MRRKQRTIGGAAMIAAVVLMTLSCKTTGPAPLPENMIVWNARPMEEIEAAQEGREEATPTPEESEEGETPSLNAIDVEVLEFELPEDIGTPEDSGDEEGSPEEMVAQQVEQFSITPTQTTFQGGAVVYNYVENHVYQIFSAPLNLVNIQLEPGENIVAEPAAGDTVNFMIGTSESYVENRRRAHVFLKPLYPGLQTTLTINTDRRTYHFDVRSFEETYMPIVAFNYPMDMAEAARREAAQQRAEIRLNGNITDMDFNYEIIPMSVHRPAWMPSLVFNDGQRTYLHFPSASRAAYAPALFAIENDERVLLNYRVSGTYYIVDRVVERMELLLDINSGNIVTIQRIEGGN